MNLREAAQQALEALEQIRTPLRINTALDAYDVSRAIAALRTALAEPEQWHCDDCGGNDPECPNKPQRTEPEQEPVAWLQRRFVDSFPAVGYETCDAKDYGAIPVYTHPPQRKPLTDEEIGKIILETEITLKNYCDVDLQTDFARRIERAHGIGGEA